MKFTIELVVSTGDIEKYTISGYLGAEEGNKEEAELIGMMIDCIKKDKSLDAHNVRVKEDCIIYNQIPMVMCSNMLKLFERNYDIPIHVDVKPNTKYIPSDCAQLFKMELNRLFQ